MKNVADEFKFDQLLVKKIIPPSPLSATFIRLVLHKFRRSQYKDP